MHGTSVKIICQETLSLVLFWFSEPTAVISLNIKRELFVGIVVCFLRGRKRNLKCPII
jgi:hypothetical protein